MRRYFRCAWSYCEYYYHCRQMPCSGDAVFCKNHDFNLSLAVDDGRPVLVQTRDRASALQSYFDSEVNRGRAVDTPDRWIEFAEEKGRFYDGFMERWANNGPAVIRYEQIVADPVEAFARAVKVFAPNDEPDRARLKRTSAGLQIKSRRDPGAFRYA